MLPHFLKPFFWDYDFRSIRWETDRDLVTARIVSYGSWDAIIWLRSVISDKELKKWIVQRKGAGISPERMRFWELILKLSHKEVNVWIHGGAKHTWNVRTSLQKHI